MNQVSLVGLKVFFGYRIRYKKWMVKRHKGKRQSRQVTKHIFI